MDSEAVDLEAVDAQGVWVESTIQDMKNGNRRMGMTFRHKNLAPNLNREGALMPLQAFLVRPVTKVCLLKGDSSSAEEVIVASHGQS